MATRLYVTFVGEGLFMRSFVLSKVLGMEISMRTLERYNAFKASQPKFWEDMAAADAWYDKLFAIPAFNAIHDFELYGFGRLSWSAADYAERIGLDSVCGGSSDPVHMREFLASVGRQDLLPYVSHVGWS